MIDIDKLYKYDDPEADLGKAPEGKVVYDDLPPYVPHGWKYLVDDGKGWFYIPFGPPCNICLPPTSVSQYRHVNPADGTAEPVAVGIRNSVGGAVDPRTGDLWFSENARDWMSDDMPSDKLNHVTKLGEHFGYPYCHQGDTPDPKFGMGRKCSEFTPPVVKLGPHMAPLGMKFYTGNQFPAEYKNGIFIAEHGSWNRHKKIGYRIVFISVDPDGKNPKETVFARAALDGEKIVGRPADILEAPDGSLLVADDQTGAVTRSATPSSRSSRPARGNPAGGPPFLSVQSTMTAKTRLLFAAMIAVALPSGGVRRRSTGDDQERALNTCNACHGAKGISSIAQTPSLAGQPNIFTQYQLVFMREGGRKPGVMASVVKTLTDDQIRDLGAW